MALIEKNEIVKVLRAYNPWWQTGAVSSQMSKTLKRASYYEAVNLMKTPGMKRAIILAGPRRVGKTTILYQLVERAIRHKRDPRDVLYLTLEHPFLKLMPIDEIIQLYDQEIASHTGPRIVLLDELQYIDEPAVWLKVLVDRYPEWSIFATGSASLVFKNKGIESGVGRWITVPVPTLSFFEYVALRCLEKKDVVYPKVIPIQPTAICSLSPFERIRLTGQLEPLKKVFNEFLFVGGFPETTLIGDRISAQKIMREDIVDKVLKRDMAAFYGVRKLVEIEKIFTYLCLHIGAIVNFEALAKELQVSRLTVVSLFRCLEGAHLIRETPGMSIGGKKVLKGRSKWYVVDASMRNAVLLKGDELLSDDREMGEVVEAAVLNHVASFSYPQGRPRLGYWRDKKNNELDIAVEMSVKSALPIAIEVKYKNSIMPSDLQGMAGYMENHNESLGLVITKTDGEIADIRIGKESRVNVTCIPAHIFLFLLGQHEYNRNQAKPDLSD